MESKLSQRTALLEFSEKTRRHLDISEEWLVKGHGLLKSKPALAADYHIAAINSIFLAGQRAAVEDYEEHHSFMSAVLRGYKFLGAVVENCLTELAKKDGHI